MCYEIPPISQCVGIAAVLASLFSPHPSEADGFFRGHTLLSTVIILFIYLLHFVL